MLSAFGLAAILPDRFFWFAWRPLLEQFFKSSFLFRGQLRANLVLHVLHFFPQFRGDAFPQCFCPLLAFADNLFNPLALFGRQVEFPVHAQDEIHAPPIERGLQFSRGGLGKILPLGMP